MINQLNGFNSFNNYTNMPSYQRYSGYSSYNTPEYTREDNTAKTVGLLALLQTLALGLDKASKYFSYKIQNGTEFMTKENVRKIAQNMITKNNLDVNVHLVDNLNKRAIAARYAPALAGELDIVAQGKNAFYMNEAKLAVAPAIKPSLLPHELGHAVNAQKSKFFSFLQKLRPYSKYAPVAILYASTLMPQKDGKKDFIQRNAGVLGFMSFLPTIIEEGAASIRGIKEAKATLGKAANLAPLRKNYLFAWMTYLIAGLGVGLAAKETMLRNKE